MWGYQFSVQSARIFCRDGELPGSRSSPARFLCVLSTVWPRSLELNELVSLFTVAVVKLWHTVDGIYM